MEKFLYLISITILVTILIVFFYKRNESFSVKTDSVTGINKDISEIYTYPNCTGCITFSNKLKPMYKYNITDNRCVKNNTPGYVDTAYLNNLLNYTKSPVSEFDTCYNNYNSMYSSVYGRYILIFRQDTIKMRFSHISVHERDMTKNPLSLNSTIFTINMEKDVNGNYNYPETVLNSINTNTTFEMGPVINGHTSHTLITLPVNANIGYINIKHNNAVDAATFNGVVIVIMKDPDTIPPGIIPVMAEVVFHTTLNSNELDRIVYTYNYLANPLPNFVSTNMPTTYQWLLPCDNCNAMNGKLFKGHFYINLSDFRCYRPIDDTVDKTIINSEIPESILTTKFMSCGNKFDTRYNPPVGKFIQIIRSDGRAIGINLSKILIYSDYSGNIYTNTNGIPSLSALVTTYLNNNSLFSNALDNSESTSMITTNSVDSNIHIDLGSTINMIVSGIGLKIPIAERYNIVGLKIYVISIDESDPFNVSKMKLTGEKIIVQKDVELPAIDTGDTLSYTYLIPMINNKNDLLSQRADIVINKTAAYNMVNKYLTTYKQGLVYYQIPYIIYNMSNGRSILAKTLTDSTNTLDKINVSDAVTLFGFSSNTDMGSVPGIPNSQLLTPINARFIYINPSITKNLSNVVVNITAYDNNMTAFISVDNPPFRYELPNTDYVKYLSNSSAGSTTPGFILIDLNQDKPIAFVKVKINITSSAITNMTDSIISLVNNSGYKKYTYTFTNPIENNYIITDINVINIADSHSNKYMYSLCKSMGLCNTVTPNVYYILDDGRCFKSKTTANSSTCTGCIDLLPSYSSTNKISSIDANFDSCKTNVETRLPPGPSFDAFSTVAKNACVLCFSLKRKFTSYVGPLLTAVRSTDRATQDFYGNINGNLLNTLPNLLGSSLETWLGGAIGYIYAWYNQSPNVITGTAAAISKRPEWTQFQGYPDFFMIIAKDINGYYYLDGTRVNSATLNPAMAIMSLASGNDQDIYSQLINANKKITISFKTNKILGYGNQVIMGGGDNSGDRTMGVSMSKIINTDTINFGLFAYGAGYNVNNPQVSDNKTITVTYGNPIVTTYIDSVYMGTNPYSAWDPRPGGSFTINNAFSVNLGFAPRATFYNVYIFNTVISGADKIIMETF